MSNFNLWSGCFLGDQAGLSEVDDIKRKIWEEGNDQEGEVNEILQEIEGKEGSYIVKCLINWTI